MKNLHRGIMVLNRIGKKLEYEKNKKEDGGGDSMKNQKRGILKKT